MDNEAALAQGSSRVGLASCSPVWLDKTRVLRRLPLKPELIRSPSFYANFEDLAVFCDAFRSADGRYVFLIGPMALNLRSALDAMKVIGIPSGEFRRAQVHHGAQVVLVRVRVPSTEVKLKIEFSGQSHEVLIQPNESHLFEGERVLFTMNQNNRFEWLQDWATFHVREHGASSLLVYDNNSDAYSPDTLGSVLAEVDGLKRVLVVPWPFKYGRSDAKVRVGRFSTGWSFFAQPPMFPHALRRFAAQSLSMLNVDVDELVVSRSRQSIFRAAERSVFGVVRFTRPWIENIRGDQTPTPRHRQFTIRKKGRKAIEPSKKWAINPRRAWLGGWRAQPWTHRVYGWPHNSTANRDFFGYHFRGISTDWNKVRTTPIIFDPKLHRRDELLAQVLVDVFGPAPSRTDPPEAQP